jgi:FAD/FMN-containing dehydrogenase
VTGVDVVTADGELVHADEDENPDLLWAARGAGPGFFGIVTRYYLRCHSRPTSIMQSSYTYPLEHMDSVLRWVHEVQETIPPALELNAFALYPRTADGLPIDGADPVLAIVGFALFDSDDEARDALELLETCPAREQATQVDTVVRMTFDELYDTADTFAGPEPAYAGDNLWSDASADELVPAFEEIARDLPTGLSYIYWWPWAPQPIENAALSITGKHYISAFACWTDPADEERCIDWGRDHIKRLDHLSNGIQLAEENLLGRPDSRFMTDENLARLEELRAKWDPEGRFHTFLFGDS